jgi:hypothetical protein
MPETSNSAQVFVNGRHIGNVRDYEIRLLSDVGTNLQNAAYRLYTPRGSNRMLNREKAEEIWDTTLKNGGGTFIAGNGKSYDGETGFVVAVNREADYIVRVEHPDVGIEAIRGTARAYPYGYLGTWVFEESVYIEPVEIFHSRAEALDYARDRRQKAIFDLSTKESIYVPRG